MPTYLDYVKRVSALVYPVRTRMFVTSTNWAKVAAEVAATPGLQTDKWKKTPTMSNFSRLNVGTLTVVNSGTEDQDVCNALNRPEEAKTDFVYRRDHWGVRPGEKKEIEAQDETDNQREGDDLKRELQNRLRSKYQSPHIEVV